MSVRVNLSTLLLGNISHTGRGREREEKNDDDETIKLKQYISACYSYKVYVTKLSQLGVEIVRYSIPVPPSMYHSASLQLEQFEVAASLECWLSHLWVAGLSPGHDNV